MISTHILDLKSGQPAKGVPVSLEIQNGNDWTLLQEEKTNDDGRINFSNKNLAGVYRLNFKIQNYQGADNFFVSAPVSFKISDTSRKYHIPLLLSPYGYSTYRGS